MFIPPFFILFFALDSTKFLTMKKLLLGSLCALSFISSAQINYTVEVLRLKAYADDCDGGSPFCLNAPQDPIFNMWITDGGGNENTSCWIYENDDDAGYGMWIDIQNLEIANETNVNTTYINVEMSGFETDAVFSASCDSDSGDDAIQARQLAQQFTLASIPMGVPYQTEVNIAGIYYAEIIIEWVDIHAGLTQNELNVSMAPNPASDLVKFSLNSSEVYQLEILDLSGRKVLVSSCQNGSEINVSDLQNGLYLVHMKDQNAEIRSIKNLLIQ